MTIHTIDSIELFSNYLNKNKNIKQPNSKVHYIFCFISVWICPDLNLKSYVIVFFRYIGRRRQKRQTNKAKLYYIGSA